MPSLNYDSAGAYDTNLTYDAYSPGPITEAIPVIPHLSGVLSLAPDGSFAYVQQDTTDDVVQCVTNIVSTPLGQRTMVPLLGIPDPTFQTQVDKNQILQAIAYYEPRAQASVDISYTEGQTNVQVNVALVRGTAL